MARTKELNIVVQYGDTGWVVNDRGQSGSPRFELYNTKTRETLEKVNDPMKFDRHIKKMFQSQKIERIKQQ